MRLPQRGRVAPRPMEFPLRGWPAPRLSPLWQITIPNLTRCHALVWAFGALWAGGAEGVVRIDPTTHKQDWVTGAGAQAIEMFAMDGLYVAYNQAPLRMDRIDSITLRATPFIIEDPSQGRLTSFGKGSICSDGKFIYAVPQQMQSALLVYGLDGKLLQRIPLQVEGKWLNQAHNCKTDGEAVYITSADQDFTNSLAVCKVVGNEVVASTSLAGGTITDDMGMTAGALWLGEETTSNLIFVNKMDLSNEVLPIALPSICFLVKGDGAFIWMGFTGVAGLVRVDPFSLSRMFFSLPQGLEGPNEMDIDPIGYTAYFSCWQPEGGLGGTDPTKIFAVDLTTMQVA